VSVCLSVCAHVCEHVPVSVSVSMSVSVSVSVYVAAVVCLSTYVSERLRVWEGEGGQNGTTPPRRLVPDKTHAHVYPI